MNELAAKTNIGYDFTDEHFAVLAKVVTDETGIELPAAKKSLMYSRLVRRLRALGLNSFDDYVALVSKQMKSNDTEELLQLVNAMTTNVTSFFRENHHFTHLTENLGDILAKFGKVRIWSMASSTGQEPWSIAITVKDWMEKNNPTADIKIIATDIDSTAIATATNGVYSLQESAVEAEPRLKKWLEKQGDAPKSIMPGEGTYRIKDGLRKMIEFKCMNLLKPWTINEPEFHIVFCRNVIIYFSKETQRGLFKNVEKIMPSGAMLYLGHSESLVNVSELYESAKATTYKRL